MRSRSNVSGSKRPVAALRSFARSSAGMNILKRNLNTACITVQTVACDQCRIKVFGGLRLDTLMGPYRHITIPWFLTHIATPVYHPQENVKLQMTVGIRVLLVELNV